MELRSHAKVELRRRSRRPVHLKHTGSHVVIEHAPVDDVQSWYMCRCVSVDIVYARVYCVGRRI